MSSITPTPERPAVTIKRGASYVIVAGAGVALLAAGGALPTVAGLVVGAVIGAIVDILEFDWWDYNPDRWRRFVQGVVVTLLALGFAAGLVGVAEYASAADVASGLIGLAVGHAAAHHHLRS